MVVDYPVPDGVRLLVKEGAEIDFNTLLFESKTEKEVSIDIASKLGINPKNIFRHLVKLVGDSIDEGEMVALKKGLFADKKSFSPHKGIIKEVDHNRGLLILEYSEGEKVRSRSPFKGKLVKAAKTHLEINIGKAYEFDLKSSSSDFGGQILYLEEDPPLNLTVSNAYDRVIVRNKISPFTQIKSEALGVAGFVTLEELSQPSESGSATVKNIDDIKKILKHKYSYCTIVSKSAKIYFYQ